MAPIMAFLGGLPGSGKGTQAALLSQRSGFRILSAGTLLREEAVADTPLGKTISAHFLRGELIPDAIITELLKDRFDKAPTSHLLLEGIPRNTFQLAWLCALLEERQEPPIGMIYLQVPLDQLVDRLRMRRVCPACGRIYNLQTAPPQMVGFCDIDRSPLVTREDDVTGRLERRLSASAKAAEQLLRIANSICPLFVVDGSDAPEIVFGRIDRVLQRGPTSLTR
jgi:adenylate kinase